VLLSLCCAGLSFLGTAQGQAPAPSNQPTAPRSVMPGIPPVHDEPAPPAALPISLDTVLRLAEEQNAQIRLARARVREACAQRSANPWLPDIYVGPAYYRHEGGIQNEDGTLTHSSTGALFAGMEISGKVDVQEMSYRCLCAERRAWQQKCETSRVTSDKLLEASTAYIDLLAARTAEALFQAEEAELQTLLADVQHQASVLPTEQIEVPQIQADLQEQRQALRKAREQAASAATQLGYLLDLDPHHELQPIDPGLVPLALVNLAAPVDELVTRALANGPGVRELDKLLALSHEGLGRAGGVFPWLPTLEVRMAEGGFGAGPGDDMRWDNRWDLGLQARWNLTGLAQARGAREAAQAQAQGAALACEDLHGKLTAGVRQARESALSAAEQMALAEQQIDAARCFYDLGDQRLSSHVTNGHTELLLARRAVLLAQLNYANAVRAYDRAQLQLLILLGPGPAPACQAGQPEPPRP
jgi:outer membrane protein TolC